MVIFIVIMGFAVAVFSYALSFPGASNFRSGNWIPGPGFFPLLLAIILFFAAGAELVKVIRRRADSPGEAAPDGDDAGSGETAAKSPGAAGLLSDWGMQNVLIVLALMFSFPLFLERIGFAILGFVTVFVITWRLKAGLLKSVAFSAVAVILTIFFFRYIFYMELPIGVWSPTQYFGY